ncbi:glycoside hydrolase family 61 protein [Flagelloscypha sp. PMI_526]|nr:glycoside hydrolase family 61 protein [Flagelloscypha sp. PMI_526]
MITFFVSLLTSFAIGALAHATWQELWLGDVDAGSSCVRLPLSNVPLTNVSSTDIACNVNPSSSSGVCPVKAGSQVTVEMHQQPNDRSCANDAIGEVHYGPVIIYMAKVSDATTAVGSTVGWFKVSQTGLLSNNWNYWANQVLNDNCGHYTFTIPADIEPGDYLLRAEEIALHLAGVPNGAQFYVSCYQIRVIGSGSASPSTVKFPGAYASTDPGLYINLYNGVTNYRIPGPTPYGTTSVVPATTVWPTTATWNTALQPSTVPTIVPTVT